MNTLKAFFFTFILSSCSGSYYLLPESEIKQIPLGSRRIIVEVPYEQETLLTHMAKYFSREGFSVQADKIAMQTSTGFKSIEGGATVRMVAAVDTSENGSKVTISGEWGLNNDGQASLWAFGGMPGAYASSSVVYEGRIGSTKAGIAFQHMVLAAKSIPLAKIKFTR